MDEAVLESGLASSQANFQRARRLVFGYARECLERKFAAQWMSETGAAWSDGAACGAALERRMMTGGAKDLFEDQQKLVRAGKLGDFDVTLLARALRGVGKMTRAQSDALASVRKARNDLAHASADVLSDIAVDAVFAEIGRALMDHFGATQAAIDRIKAAPLHEDTTEFMRTDANAERAARDHKETGNRLYRDGKFTDAVSHYTTAAMLGAVIPQRLLAEVHCNRSQAYARLGEWPKAHADADFATKLEPLWFRTHQRLAEAQGGQQHFRDAATSYERALMLAPAQDNTLRKEIAAARDQANVKASKQARREELNTAYSAQGSSRGAYADAMRARAGPNGIPALPGTSEHPVMQLFDKLCLDDASTAASPELRWMKGYRHISLGHAAASQNRFDDALREYGIAANDFEHPEGMYNLAVTLLNGLGTARSVPQAEYWARRGTEQPEPNFRSSMPRRALVLGQGACWHMLGNFQADGLGSFKLADRTAARPYYEKSAAFEYAGGLNSLGTMYLRGDGGVTLDYDKANDLFLLAAEYGDNVAMFNMGQLSEVRGAYRLAIKWYEAASKHGALYAIDSLENAKRLLKEFGDVSDTESSVIESTHRMISQLFKGNNVTPFSATTADQKPPANVLRGMQPRTPYLENLTDACELFESATVMIRNVASPTELDRPERLATNQRSTIEYALTMAARAARMPDAQLVVNSMTMAALWRAATVIYNDAPQASLDAVTILSLQPPTPTTISAVTFVRQALDAFPGDGHLCGILGMLLMYPGADYDVDEGLRNLTLAYTAANRSGDRLLMLDRHYSLGAALTKSEHAFQRQQGAEHLAKFLEGAVAHGHRKVAKAHFLIGLNDVLRRSETGKKDTVSVRMRYDAGMAALAALPPFFERKEREDTTTPTLLLSFCNPELVFPKFEPPGAKASNDLGQYGGNHLFTQLSTVGPRLLRSGATDQLIRLRREHVDNLRFAITWLGDGEVTISSTTEPPLKSRWRGDAAADSRLRSVLLQELLAAREDKVYEECALTLLVVSLPIRCRGFAVLAEDARRDCVRLAVYNASLADQALWVPGRVVRIRNPYVRLAADDATTIRVDFPTETVTLDENVVRLCWICLVVESSAKRLQACSKCSRAMYCSRECQREDWINNGHKESCTFLQTVRRQ
jgi:TPR repeat protein